MTAASDSETTRGTSGDAAAPRDGRLVRTDRPDEELSELELGEAIAVAVASQQHGFFDAAEQLYERILAVAPDHPDALHFSALLLYQKGDSARGLERLRRAIALRPDAPGMWSNLGNILLGLHRHDEAGEAYERSARLDPENADLLNNLGVLRRAQKRHGDAEALLRRAVALRPQFADAWNNLGNVLRDQNRLPEAVEVYLHAITVAPQHPDTRKLLAIAYQRLGQREKAEEIYRAWLKEEPDNPFARHYLVACTGIDVPARAPDAYVEAAFDKFAESFDAHLEGLLYRAPELLADAVAAIYGAPVKQLDVLDAGCGTGLCGPLVTGYARRLVGVDLSGEMLARARSRALYEELHKGELTAFLASAREEYDLIISADTLCYFGELNALAAAAYGALKPGGRLVFTVEALEEAESSASHRLEGTGRYAHTRAYLDTTFTTSGFVDLRVEAAHLRLEAGRPVLGFVVICRKPTEDRRS